MAILFLGFCLAYAGRNVFRTYGTPGSDFPDVPWVDFEWTYSLGACLRNGESPYSREAYIQRWKQEIGHVSFDAVGWFNLPTQALVALPLAYLPYPQARLVFNLLSFASLIAILGLISAFLRAAGVTHARRPGLWIGLGAVCLISSVPAVIFVGQPDLLVVAATLGAIYLWRTERPLLAACAIVLASMKWPLALLSFLFIFFRRGAGVVLLGGILSVLTSLPFLALMPLEGLLSDARSNAQAYLLTAMAQPPRVTGLVTLLHGLNTRVSTSGLIIAGAVATALIGGLWRSFGEWPSVAPAKHGAKTAAPLLRTRFQRMVQADLWFFPFLLTGVFVQLKPYDMLIYGPLVAAVIAAESPLGLLYAPGLVLACRSNTLHSIVVRGGLDPARLSEPEIATWGALWVLGVHLLLKVRGAGGCGRRSGLQVGGECPREALNQDAGGHQPR